MLAKELLILKEQLVLVRKREDSTSAEKQLQFRKEAEKHVDKRLWPNKNVDIKYAHHTQRNKQKRKQGRAGYFCHFAINHKQNRS